jgi:phosphatidylserine/phosphatidylglycerophosphate/cardiolipin synthase-like enzyme
LAFVRFLPQRQSAAEDGTVTKGIPMSRSIIVLPDDSAKPILEAIANAAKSIRIKIFIFSDPSLLQAVITAQRRGVDVRIMLNPERRDGGKENHDARKPRHRRLYQSCPRQLRQPARYNRSRPYNTDNANAT